MTETEERIKNLEAALRAADRLIDAMDSVVEIPRRTIRTEEDKYIEALKKLGDFKINQS